MNEQSNVESLKSAGTEKMNRPLLLVAVPINEFLIPTDAKGRGSLVLESITTPSMTVFCADRALNCSRKMMNAMYG